jgi:hypothetical protein
MAKHFGFLGKKESFDEMRERIRRSQQMGKQIHLKNMENIKNNQIETQKERDIALQEDLIKETISENVISSNESIELNTGSFDFLNDIKDGPQASGEKETEDNA